MDNIDQSQTNDPSAYRNDPPDAAPSDTGTPASQDAAMTTAPQQEAPAADEPGGAPAAAPALAAAETVVLEVAGVAAGAVVGSINAAAQAVNTAPVTGDAEFVRARLHAIETHALTWGGEVGAAIRNEAGALMDHLGVPRPN